MSHLSIAGILTALLCSSSGCGHSNAAAESADKSAGGPAAAQEAAQNAAPVRVTAGTPQRKDLKLSTSQPAWIEAWETTPLHPKITAYVDDVLVDIGDRVTKDQPLLRLSVPELHDELRQKEALAQQAEAEVGQAQANLEAARAAVDTAKAQLEETSAGILRAEAGLAEQQAEYERVAELVASRSVTQKLFEEATGKLKAAEAAVQEATAVVESARAGVRQAEAGVRMAEADVVAAQARRQVAAANVSHTETMLAYTEIKAPYDGVVTQRNVDTGHYVQPSAGTGQPLLVVASTDQLRIFIDVPEGEAARVDSGENGDSATVRIPALDGQELICPITRTSWALDPANRSLRVEIDCANDDGGLRPGMYATATVLLDEVPNALSLPATAVLRSAEGAVCYVVRDGKAIRTPIQTGLRAGDDVEVISGIAEDSNVILVGAANLGDGQAVEVIGAK